MSYQCNTIASYIETMSLFTYIESSTYVANQIQKLTNQSMYLLLL